MKKTKSILIFIVLILLLASSSFAAEDEFILVGMNGRDVKVRKVSVILDGQALVSDVPSFILVDRTMVPIRMVAENYGAQVEWEQKTKTATVLYEDKKIDLTIDSPMASINEETRILDKNSIPKLVSFSKENASTMVPLAFISEILGYEVGYDEEEKVPYINSKTDQVDEEIDESQVEEPMEKEAKVKIEDIRVEEIDGRQAIVVYGQDLKEYKTMNLNNPDRYVMDFLDASLEDRTYFENNRDAGFIKGFRVSQFSPDNNYKEDDKIVRLVLDIKAGIANPKFNIIKEKERLIIYPEESSWKNIEYSLHGVNRLIEIQNKEIAEYKSQYFEKGNLLQIEILSKTVDLKEGKIIIKDGLIDNINIVKNSKSTVVYINFQRSVEHELLSKEMDESILLKFKRGANIPVEDRTIVIDPGHGGRQPGATSPNGTREKDVNLQVSLKTKKLLEDLGYNVLMTREDDREVGIYDRVDFANDKNADIFISFHANASEYDRDINGVEILYCPAFKGDKGEVEQYPFAKSILDAYIEGTGANDRGVKQRSDLPVVRMTRMPAVLIEMGYLTNEAEERLIIDDGYQDKIADSVIKGIENYFEIY